MNLDGKTIGVIGFNARPIACSLTKARAQVYVSDYWGDDDLAACCKSWRAVRAVSEDGTQNNAAQPLHQVLVRNFMEAFSSIDFDYLVIGSGFDDYPQALEELEERWYLTGSSIQSMRNARDSTQLAQLAEENGVYFPQSDVISSPKEAERLLSSYQFPVILRGTGSGGGSGIKQFMSKTSLLKTIDEKFSRNPRRSLRLQEYISGSDISSTVLSTQNESRTLSIQAQLIGMPSAGRNCDYAYCGNYFPSPLSEQVCSTIATFSEKMSLALELEGLNGLDYVVDRSDRIFLLEVNPRITGALEMLEVASRTLLTPWHIKASEGSLIQSQVKIAPVVKLIVYSRKTGRVPDLTKFNNSVDRSPVGALVKRGEPVCTLIRSDPALSVAYSHVINTAGNIQASIIERDGN
jgi:predicted ATP-grasp superfamily ATP-dependent carboligase